MKKRTFLCDQKFVFDLAMELDLKPLTLDSTTIILNQTEIFMTSIILQIKKFAKFLKRDIILLEDINIALDQTNNQNLSMGKINFQEPKDLLLINSSSI
jgi:hypothetical protein